MMFLLTESTLFFLTLALNGRTSKKFSKGGQLKNWAAIVAKANGSASPLTATSTIHTPPPTSSGCTTASALLSTAPTSLPPASTRGTTPVASAKIQEAAALDEIFADDVDEMDELAATLSRDKGKKKHKPKVLSDDDIEVSLQLSYFVKLKL